MLQATDQNTPAARRHVVIVGGGFGGLACARELGNSDIEVTVIDRRNHNLFQPLLYQVATAALSPADISEPIRRTLGRYRNIRVLLGEVTGLDLLAKCILLDEGEPVHYDILVLATGSEYNYFGHEDWRAWAPGLKTIHEARLIRQRLLLAFEKAELSTDSEEKQALLTSVVIGGGPTGVEMAGAIAELGHFMISRDFRRLQPEHFRVILVEAGPRILSAFPEELADYARKELEKAGVEVLTNLPVESISKEVVVAGGRSIRTGSVIWGAGVKASPAALWLGIEGKAGGRIPVNPDLSVTGHPDVYSVGDTALGLAEDGKPLPALAQVAKQQGEYLGKALRLRLTQGRQPEPFRFNERGNTAVIGRNAAIFDFGKRRLKGRFAWFLWAIVHVYLLVNFEKRLLVSIQWIWRYATRQRGARIIDENAAAAVPASTERTET
ncbi:Putative transmembrane respiratory NADH-dehydrogenase (Putative Ubiquinone reductase); PNDR family protein [Pseudorhizobium banfieldiae]|uniref:NADH:ubiquinone reductase (non-electrogenic) n=1 Tax=Pseudorhizobium banfieldiae TaxID=1125847 RepID=L0NHM3_9HYPH|nr:NAD(P)/FAD-dependent oxidoreductase [Pseudorhizobium banfieldiae]CAD6615714.1 NAD(P)/FAD-dependent oxidoreductase [arsenite-oxidising bacterium NT-25]CCF20321.1 Putative transmembrane respiratory NADH-dehydrogenase (Putative Ubiquinone reductase); PNDR family protein [Pseudorhizobium banfieldiae]